ncbi:MAG: histidine triad nucleotide-binding protein [Edaphobacter sp.]|uniref:histidine triad nucleotide-binding protein n=1 Tax=Edaphobacter sp. TaxID=1934404 RepID=UPI0023836C93|nr:histidine triad nucleotide-binding protein [Edaphobacter sp.]MDE1177073.1 histidine triad nucleotide-binding protein [Edaphobacter sp.]
MTPSVSALKTSPDCLFCRIIAGEIPANRVYEDEHCIAFPDINPQAPTHLLIIPKEHMVSVAKTLEEHKPLLGHMMATAAELAKARELEKGFRIVVNTGDDGGQTVHHLHLHLLGGRRMSWPPG